MASRKLTLRQKDRIRAAGEAGRAPGLATSAAGALRQLLPLLFPGPAGPAGSNGDITINGANITLTGSGKITVQASSDVVIKGSKVSQN